MELRNPPVTRLLSATLARPRPLSTSFALSPTENVTCPQARWERQLKRETFASQTQNAPS